jgi:hypothetical protein
VSVALSAFDAKTEQYQWPIRQFESKVIRDDTLPRLNLSIEELVNAAA